MTHAQPLIGFVGNQAELLPCLLRRFHGTPWLAAADGVQQWGVGQYMGAHAIRRMQPGRLKEDLALGDLLVPRASSPMLIARASLPGSPALEDEQPFRFGSWFLAPQEEISADGQRAMWLAALPAFLRRARSSRGDTELLFLRLIARLHDEHLLDAALDDETKVALALRHVATAVDPPTNMLVTNGQALFAYRAALPLYYCMFAGIEACAPCRVGDEFTQFAPVAQSHHSFRGVCVASSPFDAGEPWQEIPAGTVLVVGLTGSTRFVGDPG